MADFRTFDPCNLLAPVPAVMVSCRAPEVDAKPNIVTVAWVGTVNSEPPMCPFRYAATASAMT